MSGAVKPYREGMKEATSEPTYADKLAGHKWVWNLIKDIESISYFTFQGTYPDGGIWTAAWPDGMFATTPNTRHIIVKKFAFDIDRTGPYFVNVSRRDDKPTDEFIHNPATGRHERTQIVEFNQTHEADDARATNREYTTNQQKLQAFRDQLTE